MDIEDLSDEEFMRLPPPPVDKGEVVVVTEPVTEPNDPPTNVETVAVDEPAKETGVVDNQDGQPTDSPTPKEGGENGELVNVETKVDNPPNAGEDPTKDSANKETDGEPAPTAEVDWKEKYSKIMAPFKANGKVIELKDESEAIKLMQMGANYTKNMQMIAPHRKLLMTLQNAGLADNADALNFLIDLHQKKPEAIAKLVADSNINPLDIDVSTAPSYTASNHQVADQTVAFTTTLDEIVSTPNGDETISRLRSWDQASIDAAYANPAILTDYNQHVSLGVAERVDTEIERLKILGYIPTSQSYLSAYETVFDRMAQAGAFADLVQPQAQKQTAVVPERKPIESKPAPVTPVVQNNAKAAAAAPTKAGAATEKSVPNLASLPDDQFMAQFEKLRDRL